MAISVNVDLCIGCGACAATCPDVFQMNDEGKSTIISQDNVECGKNAAEACPVKAIAVE